MVAYREVELIGLELGLLWKLELEWDSIACNFFTLKNGRQNRPTLRFFLFCHINDLDECGQQPMKLVFLRIYEINENDNFLMCS